MSKLFITGTDTNIGKTYVSVRLLNEFNHQGYSTLGIKPLATGIENEKNANSDVITLHNHSSVKLGYQRINAFTFPLPIAPHLAAKQVGIRLSANDIVDKISPALNHPAQIKIVEGIGGWQVPLNEKETMEDVVRMLELDVILVVGIRLGCLNHALLTAQAIRASGVNFIGWIANCLNPAMPFQTENINTLKQYLAAPHLRTVLYNQTIPIHHLVL